MFRHTVLLAAGAMLLATRPAAGQNSLPAFHPKSPAVAMNASLLGTVLPAAIALEMNSNASAKGWLLFTGIFLGPGTGYFYAGRPDRAFNGFLLRLGIAAVAAVGMYGSCGWSCTGNSTSETIGLVGVGALGVSMLYDIRHSAQAVRDWNAKHERATVSVVPQVNPLDRSAGVAVRLTF
jgi:hypothetical protein